MTIDIYVGWTISSAHTLFIVYRYAYVVQVDEGANAMILFLFRSVNVKAPRSTVSRVKILSDKNVEEKNQYFLAWG